MSSVAPVEFPKISSNCSVAETCNPRDVSPQKYYPYNYSLSWNFAFATILIVIYFVLIFMVPALALPILVVYLLVAYIAFNSLDNPIYKKRTFLLVVEAGRKPEDQMYWERITSP